MADNERTYYCRICGRALDEVADFDPRGMFDGQPSYLHRGCAMVEREAIMAAQRAKLSLLEKAAPDLLAACKLTLPAILWAAVHSEGNAAQFSEVEKQLRAAIAKATGAKKGE